MYISMSGDNAMTSKTMDRNPAYSLEVPKSMQHWYAANTPITLPCGTTITVPKYDFLKYNLCAFQGETITASNGNIIPNIYWIGNARQTNTFLRVNRRTNVNASLSRTFSIKEELSLEVSAQATNFFNHPEFNGAPGTGLGSMNLQNNPSAGLIPGNGSSSSYGAYGPGTYDPRQIVMQTIIKF